MNKKTKILFIIYTPFHGFLPKRMAELTRKAKMEEVDQIVVTPETYEELIKDRISDTVHLITLTPDSDVDTQLQQEYFHHLPLLTNLIDTIKTHNVEDNKAD